MSRSVCTRSWALRLRYITCWISEQYAEWSKRRAGEGRYLVVPTSWRGEPCLRICIVHPLTELGEIVGILDDLATYQTA